MKPPMARIAITSGRLDVFVLASFFYMLENNPLARLEQCQGLYLDSDVLFCRIHRFADCDSVD